HFCRYYGGDSDHPSQSPVQWNYSLQCLSVIFGGLSVESDNATLTIQGPLLLLAGDLRVTMNAESVTISWSAPFSLNVTGVDPDIWYLSPHLHM
ncbi:hypothetical protein GBAR_LOCUS28411, partial [Geodia barretti]